MMGMAKWWCSGMDKMTLLHELRGALRLTQNCCHAIGSKAEMKPICKAISSLSRPPLCACHFLGWSDSGIPSVYERIGWRLQIGQVL